MANEFRQELYDALSKKDDFGDFAQFNQALDDPDHGEYNQQAAYDMMHDDGWQGSFDDFKAQLGASSAAPREEKAFAPPAAATTAAQQGRTEPQYEAPELDEVVVSANRKGQKNPYAGWDEDATNAEMGRLYDRALLLGEKGSPALPEEELDLWNHLVSRKQELQDEANKYLETHTWDWSEASEKELQDIYRQGESYVNAPTMMGQAIQIVKFNSAVDEINRREYQKAVRKQTAANVAVVMKKQSVAPSKTRTDWDEFVGDYKDDALTERIGVAINKHPEAFNQAVTWARRDDINETTIEAAIEKCKKNIKADDDERVGDRYNDNNLAVLAALTAELEARKNKKHGRTIEESAIDSYIEGLSGKAHLHYEAFKNHQPGHNIHTLNNDAYHLLDDSQDPFTEITQAAFSDVEGKLNAIHEKYTGMREQAMEDYYGKGMRYAGGSAGTALGGMNAQAVSGALGFREYSDALSVSDYTAALKKAFDSYDPERLQGYLALYMEMNGYDPETAKQRFAATLDRMFREKLTEKYAPKSRTEYFVRKFIDSLMLTKLVESAAMADSGLKGYTEENGVKTPNLTLATANQAGLEHWEKTHTGWIDKTIQFATPLVGLVADYYMLGFLPAELAGKGAAWAAGKLTSGFLKGSMADVTGRAIGYQFIPKAIQQTAGGIGNFTAFNVYSSIAGQKAVYGYVDYGQVAESAAHGVWGGALVGVVGSCIGKAAEGVSGYWVYGVEAAKIAAEAGAITGASLLLGEKFDWGTVGDNTGMVVAMRLANGGAWHADVKRRLEGDKKRDIYAERLNESEHKALSEAGYGNIADLLIGEIPDVDINTLKAEHNRMAEDKNVPVEVVHLSKYILTGQVEMPHTIAGYTSDRTKEGGYRVTVYNTEKRAISYGLVFNTKAEKDAFLESLRKQIVINKATLAETALRTQESAREFDKALRGAMESFNAEIPEENKRWTYQGINIAYQTAKQKQIEKIPLVESEKRIVNAVESRVEKVDSAVDAIVKDIETRHGVKIRELLAKKADKLTEAEKKAIDELTRELDAETSRIVKEMNDGKVLAEAEVVDAANAVEKVVAEESAPKEIPAEEVPKEPVQEPEQKVGEAEKQEPPKETQEPTKDEQKPQGNGEVAGDGQLSNTDKQPNTVSEEPMQQPVTEAQPQPAPSPQPTAETEKPREIGGKPADYGDIIGLWGGTEKGREEIESYTQEEIDEIIKGLERERRQSHDYADGLTDKKPSTYDYWVQKDGLVENREGRPAETPKAETPVETPKAETPVETHKEQEAPTPEEQPTNNGTENTEGAVTEPVASGAAEPPAGVAEGEAVGTTAGEEAPGAVTPGQLAKERAEQVRSEESQLGFTDTERAMWSNIDKGAVEAMHEVAKRLGLKIRTYYGDPRERGKYIDGTIYINGNYNGKPIGFILGHEVGHDMKEQSPELYERFQKLALEMAKRFYEPTKINGVEYGTYEEYEQAYYDLYRNHHYTEAYNKTIRAGGTETEAKAAGDAAREEFSRDMILEEITNDEMGRLLTDPERVKRLFSLESDAGWAERAYHWLYDWVDRLLVKVGVGSEEHRLLTEAKNALRDTFIDVASRVQKTNKEAVERAVSNPEQFAEEAKAASDRRESFSIAKDAVSEVRSLIADGKATEDERKALPILEAAHADMRGDRTIDQGSRFSLDTQANAFGLRFEKDEDGNTHFYEDLGRDDNGEPVMGKEITKFTPEHIERTPVGAVLKQGVKDGTITEEQYRKTLENQAAIMQYMKDTPDLDMFFAVSGAIGYGQLPNTGKEKAIRDYYKIDSKGRLVFTPLKSNSEAQYATTFDVTTICRKTQTMIDVMSKTMMELGRGLTVDEVIEIVYDNVYKMGKGQAPDGGDVMVPCNVCYVFNRWVNLGNLFDKMRRLQDRYSDMSFEEAQSTRDNIMTQLAKHYRIMGRGKDFRQYRDYIEARERYDAMDEKEQEANKALKKQLEKTEKGVKDSIEERLKIVTERINEINFKIFNYEHAEDRKNAPKPSSKDMRELDQLKTEQDYLEQLSWFNNVRLKEDYVPVPNEILFDINRSYDFKSMYPDSWKFRTTRGSALGKAAAAYSPEFFGAGIVGAANGVDKGVETSRNLFMERERGTDGRMHYKYIDEETWELKPEAVALLRKAQDGAAAQNYMNGQRFQSTSDFRSEFITDYNLFMLEEMAMGAKGQGFTKVPEGAKLFGDTGVMMNLSLIAKGKGYSELTEAEYNALSEADKRFCAQVDGKWLKVELSDISGINHGDAFALSDYYANIQPIMVCVNRTCLKFYMKLANKGVVTFNIPYHKSGDTGKGFESKSRTIGEEINIEERDDFEPYQNDIIIDKNDKHHEMVRSAFVKIKTGSDLNNAEMSYLRSLPHDNVMRQLYMRFRGVDVDGGPARILNKYLLPEDRGEDGYGTFDSQCRIKAWDSKTGEYLTDADGNPITKQIKLSKAQAEVLITNDFWDKTLRLEEADRNGEAFVELCDQLGYHPRFSGYHKVRRGRSTVVEYDESFDMTREPGYWSTLIDISMYDQNGAPIVQRPIDASVIGAGHFDRGQMKQLGDRTMTPMSENPKGDSEFVYNAARQSAADVVERRENDKQVFANIVRDYVANNAKNKGKLFSEGRMKQIASWIPDEWYGNPEFVKEIAKLAKVPESALTGEGERFSIDPGEAKDERMVPWRERAVEALRKAQEQSGDVGDVSADGSRFSLSTEIEKKYPNWMDNQVVTDEKSKKGQSTQVAGTLGTYKKVGNWVKENLGDKTTILDASSGMGLGTEELRRNGFSVEDIEPYPSGVRMKENPPTYSGVDAYARAKAEGKKYDYIISNAVLNVIPDDWRANVLHDMADLLNVGGKLFINTRKTSEVKNIKNKIELESPYEVLVGTPDKITSYQRFFTPKELKAYVENELGDGYSVEIANESNSGTSGLAAVVVTKVNDTQPSDRKKFSLSPEYRKRSFEDMDSGKVPLNGKINPEEGDGKFKIIDDAKKVFVNWFGTKQNRYKGNVGKPMGGGVYLHKDYATDVVPQDVWEKATAVAKREGFDFNCLYYDPKKPTVVRFDEAPDFNTAREPITGKWMSVDASTGEVLKTGSSSQIWHNKWMWVKDDYQGFDVNEAYEWSKTWNKRISNPDGLADKWEYLLTKAGLPIDWSGSALEETATESPRTGTGRYSLSSEEQEAQTHTVNFKRWFGDWENDPENASKVVDKDGRPKVVYHQTNRKQYINKKTGQNWDDLDWRERDEWDNRSDEEWEDTWEEQDFYTFDNRHGRQSIEYPAFFFAPEEDPYHEYGERTIAVYLDIKNPAIDPVIPDAGVSNTAGRDAMQALIDQGYDGVIRTEDGVPYEYIAFRPEQIKSATENNGDFSRENPDIRYSLAGDVLEGEGPRAVSAVERAKRVRDAIRDFLVDVSGVEVDELNGARLTTLLNQAMRGQREYDKETVDAVAKLAQGMIDEGLLSGMSDFMMKQTLEKVRQVTGKEDVQREVDALMGMMILHQIKVGKETFDKLVKTKGRRVNTSGVEVMSGLDAQGARELDALKMGMDMSADALDNAISEAAAQMQSGNQLQRANARDRLTGLQIAKHHQEWIKDNEAEEAELRAQVSDAEMAYKAGVISSEALRDIRKDFEERLRDIRLQRIDGYSLLNGMLGEGIGESAERARAWREADMKRKEEIVHDANRDMEGSNADPHYQKGRARRAKDTVSNALRIVTAPLGTFANYFRYFGSKFANGEGNLYNRFVRAATRAADTEWKGYKSGIDEMDAKVSEVFGKKMHWFDLYYEGAKRSIKVDMHGKEYTLTQGSAAYIYMCNKMADGRMKLRYMGIDDAQVQRIKSEIDPKLIEIADWLQEEFLPSRREKYNEVYKRIYGTDMAEIENYFPLRINERDVNKGDQLQQGGNNKPSVLTGGIIKRTHNNRALDITRVDAFSVAAEHLKEMEHWMAFGELARDLNTLLSHKRFESQVKNKSSLRYGPGEGKHSIWDEFVKSCQIVTGDYHPSSGIASDTFSKITTNWAAANISFRLYTAAKQLLSSPVFFTQAKWWDIAFAMARPLGTARWAFENLPMFAERWQSRAAGDVILSDKDISSGGPSTRKQFIKAAAKYGMTPNAFVDACTVAAGARGIYDTKYRKYIKAGYTEEQAKQRALEDAAISVNESQQSSQGAFVSSMQRDRDMWSRMASVYRNASMGYERKFVQGLVDFGHSLKKDWRDECYRVTKDMAMRDGLSEEQADRVAGGAVRKAFWSGLANVVMFGSIAPATWSLGSQFLPMLLTGTGSDDERIDALKKSAYTHSLSGMIEGLAGGGTFGDMAEFLYDKATGEDVSWRNIHLGNDPVFDAIEQSIRKIDGRPMEAWYELGNLLFSTMAGVSPKTFTNMFASIMETFSGDVDLAHEYLLFFNSLSNTPQSAIDRAYFDELLLPGKEVKNYTAEQLAERYAQVKRLRGAGWMNLFSSDEDKAELEKKYVDKYNKKLQEYLNEKSDEELAGMEGTALGDAAEKQAKKREAAAKDERREVAKGYTDQQLDSAFTADAGNKQKRDMLRNIAKDRWLSDEEKAALEKSESSEEEKNYNKGQTPEDLREDVHVEARLKALENTVIADLEKLGCRAGTQDKKPHIFPGDDMSKDDIEKAKAYINAHQAEIEEWKQLAELAYWKGQWSNQLKKFSDADIRKAYREKRAAYFAKYPLKK